MKTAYEKKKMTFKKCKRRYDLYNSILLFGSRWDETELHRYAKSTGISSYNKMKKCIKDRTPRDKRLRISADQEEMEYFSIFF